MDTASHLLLGVTLGGLAIALAAPSVGNNFTIELAILTATIVGSNAPDLDAVIRIRGYQSYIRHHRGFSHSLPMLAGWPLLLTPFIAYLFHAWEHFLLLLIWTMAGVVLHVFLDAFNVYGVQCFRPISRKWFHGDAIPIFDPIVFGLHLSGLLMWMLELTPPLVTLIALYVLTFLFIGYRLITHRIVLGIVRNRYGIEGHSFLIPQWLPHKWGYIHETKQTYIAGSIRGTVLSEEATFQKGGRNNSVIQAAMGTDGVRSFLSFAHRVHITCQKLQHGYKVELRDVRFRHGEKLLFGIDIMLDDHLRVTGNSLGWKKKPWEPPFS